jgi:Uma2 family endonuclease
MTLIGLIPFSEKRSGAELTVCDRVAQRATHHNVATTDPYAEVTIVPRIAIRLPIALPAPAGFEPQRPETWPHVEGRLEYANGRLEFMPPCGEVQQRVAIDVGTELNLWRRTHSEFIVGGNEAGMLLGREVRAADAAVWFGGSPPRSGFARVPPILAVEVAGEDETLELLREKAHWYLAHRTEVVWIVVPLTRTVHVIDAKGAIEVADQIPERPAMPGLSPLVADFFRQI